MTDNPYQSPISTGHAQEAGLNGAYGRISGVALYACWAIVVAISGMSISNAVSSDVSYDYGNYILGAWIMLGVANVVSLYFSCRTKSPMWVTIVFLSFFQYVMITWVMIV